MSKKTKTSIPFWNAIRKYGKDNFEWKILEDNIEEIDIDLKEILYISSMNTICPNGYNLQLGGSFLKKHHHDSIEKMKKYHRNRPEEVRKKISEANKGRKQSEQWIKKVLESRKKHALKMGFWHSEESKIKIKKAHIGKLLSERHKKRLSESHKGHIHTESQKKKISESLVNNGINNKNKSGFKGVGFMESKNKWRARLSKYHLGLFDTPQEAAKAYDTALIEKYGIGNCLTNSDLGLI